MLSDAIKSQLSIIDYARELGYTPKRISNTYWTLEEMDSIRISPQDRLWIRNSDKDLRGSVIDFAIAFGGYADAKSAINGLAQRYGIVDNDRYYSNYSYDRRRNSGQNDYSRSSVQSPQTDRKPKIEGLERIGRNENNNQVVDYLTEKRGVDKDIVDHFIKRGMVYQSDGYHGNCVFISPDKTFGCIRGTGDKRYIRDLTGCNYDECFFYSPIKTDTANKTLIVTESVIDMMSVMTQLKKEKEAGITDKSMSDYKFLALSGTGKMQSLYYHLRKPENANVNRILLALDNDDTGRRAAKAAIKNLTDDFDFATVEASETGLAFRGIVEEYFPPSGKDWNDYIRQSEQEIKQEIAHGDTETKQSEQEQNIQDESGVQVEHTDEQETQRNEIAEPAVERSEQKKTSADDLYIGDVILYEGQRREIVELDVKHIRFKDLDAETHGGVIAETYTEIIHENWEDEMNSKGFEIISHSEPDYEQEQNEQSDDLSQQEVSHGDTVAQTEQPEQEVLQPTELADEQSEQVYIVQTNENIFTDEELAELSELVEEESKPTEWNGKELTTEEQQRIVLENGLRSVLDSENFKNWLSTQNKAVFKNLSLDNSLRIVAQKPTATYTMGYEQWKEFGRNVEKGAKGVKVLVPIFKNPYKASEIASNIYNSLKSQIQKDASKTAMYRFESGNGGEMTFTMNPKNKIVGLMVNDAEKMFIGSYEDLKRFVEKKLISNTPSRYIWETHFDVKDTMMPEQLWVTQKSGKYKANEIVRDDKGNPITRKVNGKVQILINNTDERKARFTPFLAEKVAPHDEDKMTMLFDVCKTVSEKNGIPVYLHTAENDNCLRSTNAEGYYCRKFTEEHPKGYIVINDSRDITNKCATLLHEMVHSELHRDVEKGNRMSLATKEIQAEAIAYSVADNFGLKTDTSSFKYMAMFAKGFDLQELKKSLAVIYDETKKLTEDLTKELQERGFNLNLTEINKSESEKLLNSEEIKSYSVEFMTIANTYREKAMNGINELPTLLRDNYRDENIVSLLKKQNALFQNELSAVRTIYENIEALNQAKTREEQDVALDLLQSAKAHIISSQNLGEKLSEEFIKATESVKGRLKAEFDKDPLKALKEMSRTDARLAILTPNQLKYIATSKFISANYGRLLKTNPNAFIERVVERANQIGVIASKTGAFVEISRCDKIADKPFFKAGTLCSPAVANKIVAECEKQSRQLIDHAKEQGEFIPTARCDYTIYLPDGDSLKSFSSSLNIGDRQQNDLQDCVKQLCEDDFQNKLIESLSEKAYARYLYEPTESKREGSEHSQSQKEEEQSISDKSDDRLSVEEVEQIVKVESEELKVKNSKANDEQKKEQKSKSGKEGQGE